MVAVQVFATFDPASVSVLGFDTTVTDFPFEVMKNVDAANSKIFVALAKQTPGVNSTQGKIGVVSLKALKDFNGSGIALKPTAANISDGSAAILDDGNGTNILAAVSSTFTNPAPPADTTPPVRTGGSPTGTLAVGTNQANLKVTTNESAICKYDPTAGTSYSSMSGSFSSTDGLSHSANVTGLSDGKSYSYYVRCSDAVNNTNNDDYKISFSVASAVEPPVSSGPVISSVTASATATSATVTWQTDAQATTQVEYGTSTNYGSTTTLDTNLTTKHSASLPDLNSFTTYHYRVKSKDASGKETVSSDYTLKTKKPASTTNPGKGNKK